MPTGDPVPDCLFCRIVAGEIPATVLWRGSEVIAFADLNPKAPVHVLVVTKAHYADIGELAGEPAAALVEGIGATARTLELDAYRTILNTGAAAGQSVFHVHAHVLAGGDLALGFGHG